MEKLTKFKVNNNEEYNYVLLTYPYGKYLINDKNVCKEIIKESIDRHENIGLCETYNDNLNQILLFDLDISLKKVDYDYEITIDHILKFIKICNTIFNKHLEISMDEINAFVLTKHNFINNKEWKNNHFHFGVHVIYPSILLNLDDKKLIYYSIINECKKKNVFHDLPLLHDKYDHILDKCFFNKTPMMVYGSSKKNNTYYKLQYYVKYNLKLCNHKFNFDELFDILTLNKDKKNCTLKNNISIIPEILQDFNQHNKLKRKKNNLYSKDLIQKLVNMLSNERSMEYNKWIYLGLCLHNIDDSNEILDVYKQFSFQDEQKASKTNFEKLWKSFKKKNEGLNIGTLKYWASKDNPEAFKKFKMDEIDKKLTITIQEDGNTSYDIAKVLKELYNDIYICSSIQKNTWYEFNDHIWKRMESGCKLYLNISEELVSFYKSKLKKIQLEEINLDDEDIEQDTMLKKELLIQRKKNISKIIKKLKDNKFKKNLMDECKHLFFDDKFYEKLDELNKHLIGFNNGIYDLKTLTFRDGRPNDYISYCTGINYIEYNENNEEIIKVYNIFNEMHENTDKTDYFLKTIAIALNGSKPQQRIDFWTGTGSNGKSLTVDFLQNSLGDYFYSPSITILTIKRKSSSNASPDLMKIKGRRILVFQEPEHDDKICTGLMKSLFGNDMICGRNLHENECSFKPQASGFLACNHLPNIPSDDGGTWRRIKVLHFPYKFTTKEKLGENEKKADLSLCDEIINLKESFMSLLLHFYKVFILYDKGNLVEPEYIKNYTLQYKKSCDIYEDFICGYIIKTDDNTKLEYKNVYSNFMEWVRENHETQNGPKKSEIKKKFELKLGNLISNRYWKNYTMKKYIKIEDINIDENS